jgi:hypothetical protein
MRFRLRGFCWSGGNAGRSGGDVEQAVSMTEKKALELVGQNGWALIYVPEEMRTLELCVAAVGQNGLALKYVPDGMRTQELCEKAAGQNCMALIYVPKELQYEVEAAVKMRRGKA